MNTRRITLLMIAFAAGVLAYGCAAAEPTATPTPTATPAPMVTPTPTPAAPTPTPGVQPKYGGYLKLSSGYKDPTHYDMHITTATAETAILARTYSSLLRATPDGSKLTPHLARSWDLSQDGLTYTIKLREGVKFHNGMTMTAEDVKYSLDRIREPPAGMASPRKATLATVSAIETPDPSTVVIRLSRPTPDVLRNLAVPYMAIYPKAVAEPLDQQGEFMKGTIPVGTGPFRLARAVRGNVYELERFEDFFEEGLPYLDGVKVYPIPDKSAIDAAFRSERLNFIESLRAGPILDALERDLGDRITIIKRPWQVYANFTLAWKEPFTNPKLREAVALALDQDEVIEVLGDVMGLEYFAGALPPTHPWALPEEEIRKIPGYGGDPEQNRIRARELLAEAGMEGLSFEIIARPTGGHQEVGILVADMLERVGLKPQLNIIEKAVFYDRANRGDIEGLAMSGILLGGATVDAMLAECCASFGGRNYGKWQDPELDQLFEEQSREVNEAKRKGLVLEYQRKFMSRFYWYFLGYRSTDYIFWNYVKGFEPHQVILADRYDDRVWIEK